MSFLDRETDNPTPSRSTMLQDSPFESLTTKNLPCERNMEQNTAHKSSHAEDKSNVGSVNTRFPKTPIIGPENVQTSNNLKPGMTEGAAGNNHPDQLKSLQDTHCTQGVFLESEARHVARLQRNIKDMYNRLAISEERLHAFQALLNFERILICMLLLRLPMIPC